jgi:Trypsin
MRPRLRALLIAGTVAIMAIGLVGPVAAITGGTPDGNAHPNVGLILFYDVDGRFRCSATLVSPTVLLTAAHCTKGTLGRTAVTFDTTILDVQVPPQTSPFPPAANPAVGYTTAEVTGMGMLAGTAVAHPSYSDFTDLRNWNDTGVIVLDQPVTSITPATIAPRDYLNAYQQPTFNSTIFTMVGYGTEVRQADTGPQKPTPMSYPLIRRVTTEVGQKLAVQVFQTNGNERDNRAGGGTCFGDSGGPAFLNGYVVGDTSYGYTNNCRYLDGYQRVDIQSIQTWLATFPGLAYLN